MTRRRHRRSPNSTNVAATSWRRPRAGTRTTRIPPRSPPVCRRYDACVDDALTQLSGLGVIDQSLWASPSEWLDDFAPFYRSDGEQGGDWALHTLGVALTAAALVLGSSFWFDLIKRLTGLRRHLVGQT